MSSPLIPDLDEIYYTHCLLKFPNGALIVAGFQESLFDVCPMKPTQMATAKLPFVTTVKVNDKNFEVVVLQRYTNFNEGVLDKEKKDKENSKFLKNCITAAVRQVFEEMKLIERIELLHAKVDRLTKALEASQRNLE